jgi:hypothetical protein
MRIEDVRPYSLVTILKVKHYCCLKSEAEDSSEMLISVYQTKQRHAQEDRKLSFYSQELALEPQNHKPHNFNRSVMIILSIY